MWVCAELGVDFEQHHGFAFRNDPWARKLNPKGTVPFIKDGGLVLNVSAPVAFYWETLRPGKRLFVNVV